MAGLRRVYTQRLVQTGGGVWCIHQWAIHAGEFVYILGTHHRMINTDGGYHTLRTVVHAIHKEKAHTDGFHTEKSHALERWYMLPSGMCLRSFGGGCVESYR